MKLSNVTKGSLALVFGLATAVCAQNFCSTAQHSGTSKTEYSSTGGAKSFEGISYELWYDRATSGSATFYSDGSLSCSFQNAGDYLCRSGMFFQGQGKTYSQLGGDIIAEFKLVKQNVTGADYSYVGVYGWMENTPGEHSLVEYYVVDNWLSQYRPGDWVGNKKYGDYTIDGAEYTVYSNVRTGPAIGTTGNATFWQYFSIRKNARDCGIINVSAHMKKWEELGMKMGSLYEAKVLGEAGSNGGGVSGTADFPHAKVYIGSASNNNSSTSSSSVAVSSSSVKKIDRKPFGGKAAAIPGVIEAENFDEGNSGETYSGTNSLESGATVDTDYRGSDYAQVGIVSNDGNGRALGYTTAKQWLEYTVDVAEAGEYDIVARVANGIGKGSITLAMDASEIAELSFVGTSNDWNAYEDAKGSATLKAGKQVLRLTINNNSTNVDYVKFTKKQTTVSSSSIVVVESSASVEPIVSSTSVVPVESSTSIVPVESSSSVEPVVSSSSVVLVESSASVEPIASSTSVVPVESSTSIVPVESSSSVEPVVSSSSVVLVESSASVEPIASSTSVVPVESSTSIVPVESSSSVEPVVSSSSVVLVESSASVEPIASSTSVVPVESSTSIVPVESSSSVEPVVSSSSVELDIGGTDGLLVDVDLMGSGKTLQVFNMLGKSLGKVDVTPGASVQEAIRAKFVNSGVYLVKNGSKMVKIAIK